MELKIVFPDIVNQKTINKRQVDLFLPQERIAIEFDGYPWHLNKEKKVYSDDLEEFLDEMAEKYGLEKIKTIGDAYMAASGLPDPCQDHAQRMAKMALEMKEWMNHFQQKRDIQLGIRIGIHTGPVVAGIIGTKKFIYDLWGDTVNLASRMESHGDANAIQVSTSTYDRLREDFHCERRGHIEVKGRGTIEAYWLKGLKDSR